MKQAFAGAAVAALSLLPYIMRAQDSYQPPQGFVPNAKTAIQIAVAVWSPIYGEKQIQAEKPFHATLNHGVWTVTGSLHGPRYIHGGVASAAISKRDGRILQVIHGK